MYVCEPTVFVYVFIGVTVCAHVCVSLWCGCGDTVGQTAQISGSELRTLLSVA